jgi:ferredoxin-NAD(P)+ reductase (naphthalene dioxygenase ferredoxin-specific)
VVVTSGANDPAQRAGLVTEAIAEDWSTLRGWRAYLCGAPPMVEAATRLTKSKGIAPEQIYADAFYSSGT